jgi:hypothetical protein
MREIGAIVVKGYSSPVGVLEVFEADEQELRDKKEQTRSVLEQGVAHFRGKEFARAWECFRDVCKQNPSDKVAETYSVRCGHYLLNPPADDWKGVIEMTHK